MRLGRIDDQVILNGDPKLDREADGAVVQELGSDPSRQNKPPFLSRNVQRVGREPGIGLVGVSQALCAVVGRPLAA
jgi:hypothetical protein